jgi:hypothetical protein
MWGSLMEAATENSSEDALLNRAESQVHFVNEPIWNIPCSFEQDEQTHTSN